MMRGGLPDRRHLSRNALRLSGILLFGGVLAPVLLLWGLTLAAAASVSLLVLYIGAAQQLGSARAQLIFSTAPFWGVTLAWTLFSEPVLPAQIAAGAMMSAALWLLYGERHDHEHTHEAVRHIHWHRHDDGRHVHTHEGLPATRGHIHEHIHEPATHSHPHRPDIQHRHEH